MSGKKYKFGEKVTIHTRGYKKYYYGIVVVVPENVGRFGMIKGKSIGIAFSDSSTISFENIEDIKRGWRLA